MDRMPIRQGHAELGNDDASRIRSAVAHELRETRQALGLSQQAVADAARISSSRLGRLERNEMADPSIAATCRAARVLGLTVSIKLYPAGSPVRDAASLALAARFAKVVALPVRVRGETALPGEDDLRAWDGMLVDEADAAFTEYEARLGDLQAMARRLQLKLRDDPRSSVLIVVVSRTRHNVRVLREHRETLRYLLPLDGAAIARELRAGRIPKAGGIIVL